MLKHHQIRASIIIQLPQKISIMEKIEFNIPNKYS